MGGSLFVRSLYVCCVVVRPSAVLQVESAPDSKERFNGRKLWPAYAKWLRPVGPSAPVAAAIIGGVCVQPPEVFHRLQRAVWQWQWQ